MGVTGARPGTFRCERHAPIVREPMPTSKTESGVEYDLLALEAIERRFWRGLWQGGAGEAAGEPGTEGGTLGPVQATVVRELGQIGALNLVLGAIEPGAVAGGHLAAGIAWAEERGAHPHVPLAP